MTDEEKAFWYKTGNEIARARERHTRHSLDDDRRTRAITQADLGKHLGLSRCSITNIERGVHRIDLYTYQRIMEYLK